jgi:hypothetical protein
MFNAGGSATALMLSPVALPSGFDLTDIAIFPQVLGLLEIIMMFARAISSLAVIGSEFARQWFGLVGVFVHDTDRVKLG